MATVNARIRDGSRAFLLGGGGGFTASVAERRFTGTFDASGARFGASGASIGVRTLAVGRGEAADVLRPVEPGLGDCTRDLVDPSGHCVRRLEYAYGAVTEWWESGEEGFEQGWLVDAPAEGSGSLVIDLAVDGAEVVATDDGVRLQGEAGGIVTIGALDAWDADGRPLRALFERTGAGFRVRVDDAGARYPVEIDPVYTTADWEVAGVPGYLFFGLSAVGLGDVNGDGYDDIAIGTDDNNAGVTSESAVLVYLGSASGLATESSITLTGPNEDYFGTSLGGGVDVNGDGFNDLIVGAYGNHSSTGAAYVYLGSAAGISGTAATTLTGDSVGDAYGTSVGGAGDVNGDGYGDVIVGAPEHGNGRAYLYLGSASGLQATPATTLSSYDSLFGRSVAGAGDVNGDGYDDVVVGESYDGGGVTYEYGAVPIFQGSSGGLSSTATTAIAGTSSGQYLGEKVASAGDVDGDGYDDVIVGAPSANSNTGRAYLYLGSATGVSSSSATTFIGAATSDHFGQSLLGPGDLNGDGYDDIVVGAYGGQRAYVYDGSLAGVRSTASVELEDGWTSGQFGYAAADGDVNGDGRADLVVTDATYGHNSPGRAFVFEGTSSGLSTVVSTYLDSFYEEGIGGAVATAGDVNADGYDDLIVGASDYLGGTGAAFVYEGSPSGPSMVASTTLVGETVESFFGSSVSSAGDVNGDGFSDVVVGAYGYDTDTGRAYVFQGGAAGLAATASTILTGAGTYYYFGNAVAGAGDVNADGYDDVVVGAYAYATYTGHAYVYRGSASGLSTSASTTLTGGTTRRFLGRSVASAGDVNHDGYADIIVGADGGTSYAGAAYVYEGSASGIPTTIAQTLSGYSVGDYFGYSVAGAGDLNGDGWDDVLVGAYKYSSSTGRAYAYLGSSAGIAASPSAVMTGAGISNYFGRSVSGAGDVDGDGYGDVIVGAYGTDSEAGAAYLYAGSPTGLSSRAVRTLGSSVAAGQFGYSVSGAGDVNGDGYADVIVGAPSDSGSAYLFFGYRDADGDGVPAPDDCDDSDPTITSPYTAYADADGDGYGEPSVSAPACAPIAGYVANALDCDDATPLVHPGAAELCDVADVDEDCNGLADDADSSAVGKVTVHADVDGDGFGGAGAAFCDAPTGYVDDATDCDDSDAAVNPAAVERCDDVGIDEDCDGLVDDADASATGQSTFYGDADLDGYGSTTTGLFCDLPAGYVANSDDCDDTAVGVNPAATEVCDSLGVDENCNGVADDLDAGATGRSTFYADGDGDGFGGVIAGAYCDLPSGYTLTSSDCDDANATVHPGAAEVCDAANVDEDCDGLSDDDDPTAVGQSTYYVDLDGDGFGATVSAAFCDLPAGYAANGDDCDDADAEDHPGATEIVGNGDDEDCDGAEVCYVDADGDSFRGLGTIPSADVDCADVGEALATAIPDCDDSNAAISAGSPEIVGDGIDEDCDGLEICFVDTDGDGCRPDASTTLTSVDLDCSDPGEASADAATGDCNDADAAYYPGAVEANCADPNDYNCDGSVGYADADGDGFAACADCDDARTAVNPDATEICNGLDDDCDGGVDVDAVDETLWGADADGDGYTDPERTVTACDAPSGYREVTGDDCDDTSAGTHPGAEDVPDDGIDENCDGTDATNDDSGAPGDTSGSGSDTKSGGCGCASTDQGAGWVALLGVLACVGARRRGFEGGGRVGGGRIRSAD